VSDAKYFYALRFVSLAREQAKSLSCFLARTAIE